jgi:glycosyltransferase involved in cell wall biosynthesis
MTRSTASRIRVALNAQINPDMAGGVESSTLSIVQYYKAVPEAVALQILCAPDFATRLADIAGPNHHAHRWGGAQERPILAATDNRTVLRARRVASWFGAASLVDDAVKRARARHLGRALRTAAENDAELALLEAQLVHFTSGPTFPTNLPFVYEPHDIQHRHYPDFFTPEELAWRDRVYGGACRGAAMCVCGSSWTKRDIVEQFGVSPERVAVIPRSSFNVSVAPPAAAQAQIVQRLGLPDRFAYYPAMTFPHKNHLRLFEAMARLRDDHGLRLHLVLTGRWHKPTRSVLESALDAMALRDQVSYLGSVDEETLATLFRRAWFVVFPSLFEGLSQSLLEALHVGTPIVAAKQTSIPETVGPGGIYFDGLDVASMVATLAAVMTQEDRLRHGIPALKEHYKRYDWAAGGPMLTAVYRHIVGSPLDEADRHALEAATGQRLQ